LTSSGLISARAAMKAGLSLARPLFLARAASLPPNPHPPPPLPSLSLTQHTHTHMRENGSVLAAAVVLGKLLATLASVAPHVTLAPSAATSSGPSPLADLILKQLAPLEIGSCAVCERRGRGMGEMAHTHTLGRARAHTHTHTHVHALWRACTLRRTDTQACEHSAALLIDELMA